MSSPTKRADSETISVRVHVAASVETTWTFLSDPQRFAAWIGSHAGQAPLPGTRVEPKVGGKLRVEYPGGTFAVGVITAVEPMRRVAFTWGYEGGNQPIAPGSTEVELLLMTHEGGTLVELRHAGIPTAEARAGHMAGWTHYVSMLAREAASAQHTATAKDAFDAYHRAWREADESARRRLLDQCCEADVRVRSQFACTHGVAELSAHIANGLKHMPGLTLEAVGDVQQLHGFARVDWAVKAPNGAAVMRGQNFAELSTAGRLRWIVSFASQGPA